MRVYVFVAFHFLSSTLKTFLFLSRTFKSYDVSMPVGKSYIDFRCVGGNFNTFDYNIYLCSWSFCYLKLFCIQERYSAEPSTRGEAMISGTS